MLKKINQKNGQKGFTLLEIIIVIIIIGVLASLALPKLFGVVKRAYAAEAFAMIATIRSSVERCYLMKETYGTCSKFDNLDIEHPNNSPNSHFDWAFTTDSFSTGFKVYADRNSKDGGTARPPCSVDINACNGIVFQYTDSASKGLEYTGYGDFKGITNTTTQIQ